MNGDAQEPSDTIEATAITASEDICEHGKLVHNIAHFSRALRRAGLPVGTGHVLMAVNAVNAAGFTKRLDFYYALRACLVSRPEHMTVFDQAFRLFWRDPRYLEKMMAMLLPMIRGVQEDRMPQSAERRVADALIGQAAEKGPNQEAAGFEEFNIEIDSAATMSENERLRTLDFEQMTSEEAADAKLMLASLEFTVKPLMSRRTRQNPRGRFPDWRATLRSIPATGGELRAIHRREMRRKWPNVIALCDISGSMTAYSRMLLLFLHAIANREGEGWAKVHAFTFGTRLTNITRYLQSRDADDSLAAIGAGAKDWKGGTRIGECLREFNLNWSRRVVNSGAVVLLISDGLESGNCERLGREIERLRLSAGRLIWINPLLRWDQFAPKAKGIRTMLPHVDCFRSAHNIASLSQLSEAISRSEEGEKRRLLKAVQK